MYLYVERIRDCFGLCAIQIYFLLTYFTYTRRRTTLRKKLIRLRRLYDSCSFGFLVPWFHGGIKPLLVSAGILHNSDPDRCWLNALALDCVISVFVFVFCNLGIGGGDPVGIRGSWPPLSGSGGLNVHGPRAFSAMLLYMACNPYIVSLYQFCRQWLNSECTLISVV